MPYASQGWWWVVVGLLNVRLDEMVSRIRHLHFIMLALVYNMGLVAAIKILHANKTLCHGTRRNSAARVFLYYTLIFSLF